MGFKEIYLLGIDASYPVERYKDGRIEIKNVEDHYTLCSQEEKNFKKDVLARDGYEGFADIDLQMDGYQTAKNYSDAHGIKIYNATRGGKLDVFDRINFDSLF